MPAFVTHSLLADSVMRGQPEPIFRLLSRRYAAFSWGALGPDLLFFKVPFTGGKELPKVGRELHQKNAGALVDAMGEYLGAKRADASFETLFAYVCGYLCHYRLDSTAHPYVYSMQQRQEGMTRDRVRGGTHHRVEADIDTAMHQRLTGKNVRRFPLRARFRLAPGEAREIGTLLSYAIQKAHGRAVDPTLFEKAFGDALFLETLMLEGAGMLAVPCLLADRVQRVSPTEAHLVRKRVRYDVLNCRRLVWARADRPEELSRKSFLELFSNAGKLAAKDLFRLTGALKESRPFQSGYLFEFDEGAIPK